MAEGFFVLGGVFVVVGGLWTLISLFGSVVGVGILIAGINMIAAGGVLQRLDRIVLKIGSSSGDDAGNRSSRTKSAQSGR